MKKIASMVPALALLAVLTAPTTLEADPIDRVAPEAVNMDGATVSVMNNHGFQVAVYLVDSNDQRYLLGRVDHMQFKNLEIPAEMTAGTEGVRIKIYPILPKPGLEQGLGLFGESDDIEATAVKTAAFALRSGHVIQLFLEPTLTRSKIAIAST